MEIKLKRKIKAIIFQKLKKKYPDWSSKKIVYIRDMIFKRRYYNE